MTQMSKYCVLTFDEMSLKTTYHKAQLTEKGDFGGLKCRSDQFVRFVSEMETVFVLKLTNCLTCKKLPQDCRR